MLFLHWWRKNRSPCALAPQDSCSIGRGARLTPPHDRRDQRTRPATVFADGDFGVGHERGRRDGRCRRSGEADIENEVSEPQVQGPAARE
jgi:hypothetical protein